MIRAAIGRRHLRAWAIHPGLGVSGLRLQDPGWGHGLNLSKTEIFEEFFVTSQSLMKEMTCIGLWHLGKGRGSTSEYAQEMPSSLSAPVSDLDPPDVKDGQRH